MLQEQAMFSWIGEKILVVGAKWISVLAHSCTDLFLAMLQTQQIEVKNYGRIKDCASVGAPAQIHQV